MYIDNNINNIKKKDGFDAKNILIILIIMLDGYCTHNLKIIIIVVIIIIVIIMFSFFFFYNVLFLVLVDSFFDESIKHYIVV